MMSNVSYREERKKEVFIGLAEPPKLPQEHMIVCVSLLPIRDLIWLFTLVTVEPFPRISGGLELVCRRICHILLNDPVLQFV